jgi:glyoxylase-like metal-dependent hydrolase (beta-lactamase superfamily II)
MTRACLTMCAGLTLGALTIVAQPVPADAVHSWQIRDNVYMLAGPGANTTVQIGRDGVTVVDPQTSAAAGSLLAAIRRLSDQPVRFIVNTTLDPDHIGGNEAVAKSGQVLAGGNTRPATVAGTGGAPIFAHEKLLNRLSESGAPPASLPTDSYFVKQKDMFVNGEAVQLLHVPAAHTDGDTIVFFRRSDVISTGDVFTPDRYPVIDLARGGSIEGLLAGINYILELAVPDFNEEGGTMIVPGHGRLCDESDVSDYRDMVTIVRDRVADMVKKKMTLEQVKAAKPTRDYDGVYARADYAGDMFVEAVYRSLTSHTGARAR